MIWQPEFTDKTLSRKPGAVQGSLFACRESHFSAYLTLWFPLLIWWTPLCLIRQILTRRFRLYAYEGIIIQHMLYLFSQSVEGFTHIGNAGNVNGLQSILENNLPVPPFVHSS